MVFSSVPLYLDPPNWQQQSNNHPGSSTENPHLPSPQGPSLPPHGGLIRPGSMTERARLAKIPQPDAALKCPRCESTNTKFCYFNNYSLSQPRHFCKTCRRYWTRGGALRNVPVGGGCRRNKKNRRSSSKSSPIAGKSTSAGAAPHGDGAAAEIIGHFPEQSSSQLPLMASLQNLGYGAGNIGLNMGGESGYDFGIGNNSITGSGILPGAPGSEAWRLQQMQQFSFLGGFEPHLYPFHGGGGGVEPPPMVEGDGALRSKMLNSVGAVKMEENPQGMNLGRQGLVNISENNQYWPSGNAWTDLSGLSS